jgi:hypothetical protein
MVGAEGAQQGPIGRKILRREDRRLLTGTARFIDDIVVAGALHARFIRSRYARAHSWHRCGSGACIAGRGCRRHRP